MTPRRFLRAAALIALLALLNACGSGKPATSSAPKPYPQATPAPAGASPQESDSAMPAPNSGLRSPVTPQAQTKSAAPQDMYYQDYGVNPVVSTARQPVSTFGIDVDTASFTLAKSYLDRGMLPPPEAVRAEEFINYFPQRYKAPTDQAVAAYVEWAPNPFRPENHLFQVSLKGREVSRAARKPVVLTFVIDVSGSMEQEGRLELVKRSLNQLLAQLDRGDQVGVVVYSTRARDLVETTSNLSQVKGAIAELQPEDSTNAEAGLLLGYQMALRHFDREAVNRVVLCSDGVANQGQTGADAILNRVDEFRGKSISLTAIGVGMGNYNDVLLEQLADRANGNYFYVNNDAEARRVFVDQLTGTLETVAKDVKVQVRFDMEQVATWRLVGYENRVMRSEEFRNDRVDSGDMGAGHSVTALYELQLYPDVEGSLGTVTVRYQEPARGLPMEMSLPIQAAATASPRVRWSAAVGEFAGVLRGSPWAAGSSLPAVQRVATQAAAELEQGQAHQEFLELVGRAMELRG